MGEESCVGSVCVCDHVRCKCMQMRRADGEASRRRRETTPRTPAREAVWISGWHQSLIGRRDTPRGRENHPCAHPDDSGQTKPPWRGVNVRTGHPAYSTRVTHTTLDLPPRKH